MSTQKLPFHQRMVGQMALLVILPTFILLTLIIVLAATQSYHERLENVRQSLHAEAALAADHATIIISKCESGNIKVPVIEHDPVMIKERFMAEVVR